MYAFFSLTVHATYQTNLIVIGLIFGEE